MVDPENIVVDIGLTMLQRRLAGYLNPVIEDSLAPTEEGEGLCGN
jgi:hypothetical protein